MKCVAVTGANGHIGNNVCRALIAQGYSVRALTHNRTDALAGVPVTLVSGSILDPQSVSRCIEPADIVIHTAAHISIYRTDARAVHQANVEGTANILQAIQKCGNKRLIHFSSIHAMDPFPRDRILDETRALRTVGTTGYDASKIAGEQMVLDAIQKGMDAIIVAPTSVYGVHDFYPSLLGRAIIDLASGKIPALIPAGYDFVFVEDIAAGVLAAIDHAEKGDKFIFSGHYHSLRTLTDFIAAETGRKKRRPVIPIPMLQCMLPFFAIQAKWNGMAPLLTRESIKALKESPLQVSCAFAEKKLGYKRTSLEEGMHKTIRWMREVKYLP